MSIVMVNIAPTRENMTTIIDMATTGMYMATTRQNMATTMVNNAPVMVNIVPCVVYMAIMMEGMITIMVTSKPMSAIAEVASPELLGRVVVVAEHSGGQGSRKSLAALVLLADKLKSHGQILTKITYILSRLCMENVGKGI